MSGSNVAAGATQEQPAGGQAPHTSSTPKLGDEVVSGGEVPVGEVRYLKVNPIRELLRAGQIVGIGARRMTHEAVCRLADDAARQPTPPSPVVPEGDPKP